MGPGPYDPSGLPGAPWMAGVLMVLVVCLLALSGAWVALSGPESLIGGKRKTRKEPDR